MAILDSGSHEGVIEWLPTGDGFIILEKERCTSEVLDVYFGISKYASFTRRLNRWNFIFHHKGSRIALYFHPLFCRGSSSSCSQIRPKPQKNYNQKSRQKRVDLERAIYSNTYSNLPSTTNNNGRVFPVFLGSSVPQQRPVVSPQNFSMMNPHTIIQGNGNQGANYFGSYSNIFFVTNTTRHGPTNNPAIMFNQHPNMTTQAYPSNANDQGAMYEYGLNHHGHHGQFLAQNASINGPRFRRVAFSPY
jgi:hypothetical protein